MQCVVLAGGLGTRMRPTTDALPKWLTPVAGRPFVDWQLDWLAAEHVDRVVCSIGHLGDMVRRHVGNGDRFGLEVAYVDEGDRPLGTAGALRLASDQGVLDPIFFVLYGDSYLPVRLRSVLEEYQRRRLPVLMTVYRNPGPLEHPNAVFEDGMVRRYEKGLVDPPPEMCFVDYGLSIWRREVIQKMVPSGEVVDLEVPFGLLSSSGQLAGYEVTDRFYEIGSAAGLRELEKYLQDGGTARLSGEPRRGPPGARTSGSIVKSRCGVSHGWMVGHDPCNSAEQVLAELRRRSLVAGGASSPWRPVPGHEPMDRSRALEASAYSE